MGSDASPSGDRHAAAPSRRNRSDSSFAVDIKEEGSTLHLRLTGEFDWACVGRVEAALQLASATQTMRVVLDLRGLSFLDMAALRAIVRAHERAQAEHFDILIVRPHGLANRVFTLTRAGERLNIVDRVPLEASSGRA